jgi:hypothetical protein
MVLLFTADVPWFSIVSVGPLEAGLSEPEKAGKRNESGEE